MSSIQEALKKAQMEKEGRERPEVLVGFTTPPRKGVFKKSFLLIAPLIIAGMIFAGVWVRNPPPQTSMKSPAKVPQNVPHAELTDPSPEKSQKKNTSSQAKKKGEKTIGIKRNNLIKKNARSQSPRPTLTPSRISGPSPEKGQKKKTSSLVEERRETKIGVKTNSRFKGKSTRVRKEEKEGIGLNAYKGRLHGQEAYKRAIAMQSMGNLERAIELYHLSTKGPERVQKAFVQLGNIYFEKKGAQEKAIFYYRKALEVNPGDAKAHNNLGTCYLKKGDIKGAMREYLKAIELRDDFAIAHYNMACALAKKGEPLEAISWLKKAIALNPESLRWANEDPDFDEVRSHRSFQELLEKRETGGEVQRR